MHGSQRHRDQEARPPWTKRQLIVYKCTLYLFIVFSLELRSCATGEEKSLIYQTSLLVLALKSIYRSGEKSRFCRVFSEFGTLECHEPKVRAWVEPDVEKHVGGVKGLLDYCLHCDFQWCHFTLELIPTRIPPLSIVRLQWIMDILGSLEKECDSAFGTLRADVTLTSGCRLQLTHASPKPLHGKHVYTILWPHFFLHEPTSTDVCDQNVQLDKKQR